MASVDTILSRNRVMWCNSVCRGRPPQDAIDGTAAAGYRHISLGLTGLKNSSPEELHAIREYARERSIDIPVLDGYFAWLPLAGTSQEANAVGLERLLTCVEAFDAKFVNVLALDISPPFETQVRGFASLCDALSDVGARATIEFTPLGGIADLASALRVAEAANRPNGGVLFDTWHFFRGNPDFDSLSGRAAERIMTVQISDAAAELVGMLWDDTMHSRRHPGDGVFRMADSLRALERLGVLDWYGPEVISDAQHALQPAAAGKLAAERLDTFLRETFADATK